MQFVFRVLRLPAGRQVLRSACVYLLQSRLVKEGEEGVNH